MLSKKTTKIVSTLMIAMMLMMMVSNVCLASDIINSISVNTGASGTSSVKSMGGTIIGFLQVVGVVVGVVILVVIGIKYVMGSAEEKAEYKKTMIPYVVGAVLIMGASFVAGMLFDFAGSIG